jgi:aminopeptidase
MVTGKEHDMEAQVMKRYAAVILDACLGLKEGDRLKISAEPCHRAFLLELAEAAYRRGARTVRFDYREPRLQRLFVDLARETWIEDISSIVRKEGDTMVEENWSLLFLTGEEDPEVLEGADPGRLQRAMRVRSEALTALREAQMSNKVIWCVVPAPTPAWGRRVFGDAGRPLPADPEAALMAELLPILRLDGPDPAAAVLNHAREVEGRARKLDSLALAELHFQGPGTDLRIGLSPRSRWIGGGSRTPEGRFFLPNHPSEEVFTSPDCRLAEGRAACTRPVEVLGAKVEGAWFQFKGGEVVDFGADRNRESLARYFETDRGARSLGEAALVDGSGPIFKSGLVFNDALIDENAACHIALGAAYDEAFEGSTDMDKAARTATGFNDSMVHTDFMIGSPEVEVTGTTRDGRSIPLITKGNFAF